MLLLSPPLVFSEGVPKVGASHPSQEHQRVQDARGERRVLLREALEECKSGVLVLRMVYSGSSVLAGSDFGSGRGFTSRLHLSLDFGSLEVRARIGDAGEQWLGRFHGY